MNLRELRNDDPHIPQHHQFGYYGDRDDQYQKSGYGIMIFPTRATYRGHWASDKMHGKGVYDWADGNRYEGEFKDGKQCGYGVYTWPSGGKYFGYWENDKMCGRGVYIRHDGVVYEGYWQNDHQVGWGIKRVPEQVCSSTDGKMVNEKAIQEYWTGDHKVLIYFELTKKCEFPRNCFVDVVVRCRDGESDSEEEEEEILLEEVNDDEENILELSLLSSNEEDMLVIGEKNNQVIVRDNELMRHFSSFGKGVSKDERRSLRAFLQILRERAGKGLPEEEIFSRKVLERSRSSSSIGGGTRYLFSRKMKKKQKNSRSRKHHQKIKHRRGSSFGKRIVAKVEKKPKRSPEIDPRSILNFKKFLRYLKSKQKKGSGGGKDKQKNQSKLGRLTSQKVKDHKTFLNISEVEVYFMKGHERRPKETIIESTS